MDPRARFPLRWKLTLWVALVAAAPLVVVGFLLVGVNERAVERSSRQLQIAIADDLARSVDEGAVDAEARLSEIGAVLGSPRLDADARLALAASMVEASETLDHVAFYDAGGVLVDVLREDAALLSETPELLALPLREGALRDGRASGDVATSPSGPRVPVVVALRPSGVHTGFAASHVSLASLQARVERLASAHLASVSGVAYVVDGRRRLLAHPDGERAWALRAAPAGGVLAGLDPAALGTRAARSVEHTDADGRAWVGTVVGLASRPWVVVVEVPRDVAYASLVEMRAIVLATIALSVLLSILAAFVLARRITAPLSTLSDFARDLAARRFDRRVAVRTDDELSILAHAMSSAAAQLEESETRIREEAAIRADLGRYLPGELVEKIVRREQSMELGGKRASITILFADVVAFTPLTERLPPEEVVRLLNELFTVLTELVFRHGGTVDKLIGDCVMAMWGAPTPQEDHARRAVEAAEDMLRWLETANASWQARWGVRVQLAIGINTGEAVVGNVGSETRMEYTAIGDVVNVAARLEAIARPQQILVTEATRAAAGDRFEWRDAGEQSLPGRGAPVRLFEVST